MTDILDHTASPPPELIYRKRLSLRRDLRELWQSRELIRTLGERDIRSRYKQSCFGFTWSIVTPPLTVFDVIGDKLTKAPMGIVPLSPVQVTAAWDESSR